MKTAEWFICLSYGKTELLIPQERIAASSYIESNSADSLLGDFDFGKSENEIIVEDFLGRINSNAQKKREITSLITTPAENGNTLVLKTSLVPKVCKIELSTLKIWGGKIGEALYKRGLIASRFYEGKAQLVIDIDNFFKAGSRHD